jgi:hypothetical protein
VLVPVLVLVLVLVLIPVTGAMVQMVLASGTDID